MVSLLQKIFKRSLVIIFMAIQSFTAKVTTKEYLTEDVIILSLSIPEDFSFKAGQFITLFITKDGEKKPRSYSILSPPSQKESLDLCIKIVPEGFASEIFSNVKETDEFEVKGPFGHFIFDEEDRNEEVVFIAGGTGVAPFYGMLKEYLPKLKKSFTLYFSVKNKEELFLHEDFLALETNFRNFKYVPTLTREEWNGATGRVQKHLTGDLKNKTFYICGLKELVLETKELLESSGVSPADIKSERYT